jgi:hypothetical protein
MMELLRHGKYLGMFKEDPKGTLQMTLHLSQSFSQV